MSPPRWPLAMLALGLCVTATPAQSFRSFNPPPGNGGINVSGQRGRVSIQITVGSFSNRAYLITPGLYLPTNQVTVVYYTPPPVVIVTPPRQLLEDLNLQAPPLLRPFEPMPPAEAGPLRPPEREQRPPPAPPKQPPAVQPEPPRQPPAEEREDRKTRLIRLGRAAMARGEYGRAAERFRQASEAAPGEALPHFLLGPALLALGKYREAGDALTAGLALDPAWPAAAFRPRDLYGPNAADYSEHLRRLEALLARHPDDPVLLFLNGYVLWFDGRTDEARALFRRALPGAANPAAIERFLTALPAPIL